jgi:alpha-tubulin suppressor-like RCC1 family protein
MGNNKYYGSEAGDMDENLDFVRLGKASKVIDVKIGTLSTCALLQLDKNLNRVKCWGYNGYGELGAGDSKTRSMSMADMSDNLPFVELGTKE